MTTLASSAATTAPTSGSASSDPISDESGAGNGHEEKKPHGKMLHPVVMMIWVVLAAVALTYLIDAGRFERQDKLVVPGTHHVVPKMQSVATLFAPAVTKSTTQRAAPASVVSAFVAVPNGLIKNAPLILHGDVRGRGRLG